MKTSLRSIKVILFARNEMFVEICHLLKSIPIKLPVLLKYQIRILEGKKKQKWSRQIFQKETKPFLKVKKPL